MSCEKEKRGGINLSEAKAWLPREETEKVTIFMIIYCKLMAVRTVIAALTMFLLSFSFSGVITGLLCLS